jgi:hypothetical protein
MQGHHIYLGLLNLAIAKLAELCHLEEKVVQKKLKWSFLNLYTKPTDKAHTHRDIGAELGTVVFTIRQMDSNKTTINLSLDSPNSDNITFLPLTTKVNHGIAMMKDVTHEFSGGSEGQCVLTFLF